MDMYDSLVGPSSMLNEQIAHQIFDILPEHGPVMAIIDRQGSCWLSNPEKFSQLNINESVLKELCNKIDDGTEPVVTQVNDCSIIAAQLATDRTNCGYVLITLPQYTPESTMTNIDIIEILLSQAGIIANLIEKNHLLHELQTKHYSVYGRSETPSN
jgi:hypothetical protein